VRRILVAGGTIALIILAVELYANPEYRLFAYPDRTDFPLRGIDVSHHQGTVDWTNVADDDVAFAYIKATEANDIVDDQFHTNWDHARAAGLLVGAYHYYSLAYPGAVQARHFLDVVPTSTHQLPPVVDIEYSGNSKERPDKAAFQQELRAYLTTVTAAFGRSPILYTTYDFYRDYLAPDFANENIWIRDLQRYPRTSMISKWTFWQYSSVGSVRGVSGNVDLNVFNGDRTALTALLN
jgi:lysozyme